MPKNITKEELRRVKEALPNFHRIIEQDEKFVDGSAYKLTSVSIFDHWLSAEESERLLNVDSDSTELESRKNKYRAATQTLLNFGPIYTWRYKRHNRLHIKKIYGIRDLLRVCDFDNLNSLTGARYGLLVPELKVIYMEGFDWTNHIYHLDSECLSRILSVFKSHGLNELKNN